jgi:tetratricopeptide (TPR) repeat protein
MAQDTRRDEGERDTILQRAGDYATQIGKVVGNVVFQITILTPKTALIILGALTIASVIGYYLYSMAQKPARMTGDFNIAVAQFGEVTDEGIVSSALATQISKLLFDYLDSEYKATDFGLNVQVAHKKIGILTEDREAEQLAYDIDADVVIYGSIYVTGDEAMLSPKFYVAEQPDALELTGQHQLAFPIQFEISSLGFQDQVNAELRSRASILVHFTQGLVYRSADRLDAASDSFQEAIDEAERYGPFDGKETLYLFAAETTRLQKDFGGAAEYLDRALSLNPEYARAYIARGNIYYDQALQASHDDTMLGQALTEYKRALEARDHAPGAYIREKANSSMGNVYAVLAQKANDPKLYAQAIYYYDQVVSEYEQIKNERIRGIAAIAYFGLGAVYERQEDYAQAVTAYQQCIEITDDTELKSRAKTQLALVREHK